MNCWEYTKCGHDVSRDCPAYPDNGQRCWLVTGTVCMGTEHGVKSNKIIKCVQCNYYRFMNSSKGSV